MEWIEKLTDNVRWSKKGTLSLKNSLPDEVPVPVQFYLSSIRPYDMANALAYIQEGATHYFAQGYVGIVFYGNNHDVWLSSSSSSNTSSEDESGDCTESSDEASEETSENGSTSTQSSSVETDDDIPLQEGEVGFFVGHKSRAKYRMPEKDFLKVMKTLLLMRRKQNHQDIPGQQEFLQYVDKINKVKEEDDGQLSNRHVTEEISSAIDGKSIGSVDEGDPSGPSAGLTAAYLQSMPTTSLEMTKEDRIRRFIKSTYQPDRDNSTLCVDDGELSEFTGLAPENMHGTLVPSSVTGVRCESAELMGKVASTLGALFGRKLRTGILVQKRLCSSAETPSGLEFQT
ncbi:hypothetical protein Bbelb_370600 [Branchiostoma belcheri]|nr:hypothetical protein Bbelb_370600 [Branchiostoma belcheri]